MAAAAGVDQLYELFKKRNRISLSEAAKVLKISRPTALKWAKSLQDDNIVDVEFTGEGVFLVWTAGRKKRAKKALPPPAKAEPAPSLPEAEREFQRLVRDYEAKLEEIKKKSADLQDATKERAELIHTKYIPMERKFETELQLLHNQFSEKEHEIDELEKRVRDMPEKVSQIEEQAQKLAQIEAYARKNVSEARVKIQTDAARFRETQASIEKYLEGVATRIDEQTRKVKRIERELIRLRKIEQWMVVQQKELENTLNEISKDRKGDLKRFSALKASVTPHYVKNYIKELKALKDRHTQEVHKIRRKEELLNAKVRKSRRDLRTLTAESKELIEKFEALSGKKRKRKKRKKELELFEDDLDSLSSSNIE
jgi:DNA repair exonuclease SbcCD ATPase subunit